MKPTLVKKNTEGGAAGLFWTAGEVKALNPYLADELIKLAPGDYEVVQEGERMPEPPVHNSPGATIPRLATDGTGIEALYPASKIIAEAQAQTTEPSVAAEAPPAAKPRGATKKSTQTETASAE